MQDWEGIRACPGDRIMRWDDQGILSYNFPFFLPVLIFSFFLHTWIGKQGTCCDFSVASSRVVSVIYSAKLTSPRIRAISVLTGPYTVFLNYLGDGSHHPFRDACHPLWASLCVLML